MALVMLDKAGLEHGLNDNLSDISILIFTEGTILGPKRLIDWFDYAKYVPIKNCVEKISLWQDQGAKINYLTSGKSPKDIESIRRILINNCFPGENLYYRTGREKYKDIAELVAPEVLIEDDCKSIGGKWQMTITHVRKEIQKEIKSVIVQEFSGIDHLPDDLYKLRSFGKEERRGENNG